MRDRNLLLGIRWGVDRYDTQRLCGGCSSGLRGVEMTPRKTKKFEDVTVELNYSQAIRNQMKFNEKYTTGDEWDEERIFHAAQFCKAFHNKTLNPYVIQKFLNEFVETVGFNVDY